jgi:hypothetical protein
MNVNCKDRDRIFEDGGPAEWAALESHAATCAACAEELRAWKALSAAAAELRDYSDSPELWPRIQRSLSEQAGHTTQRKPRWSWQQLWQGTMPSWQTALASAVVALLIASSVGWLYWHGVTRVTPPPQSSDLLKSQALDQVESAETAYVKAIDKLAASAKPQLDNPDTPLLANYREKLMVLDSAIDDLRAQTGQNPSNAHLRYELLAMYQEKQRTLEEILEVKR